MLEHARPGDRAVLRHVPDEDGCDAGSLRDPKQPRRGLAHLRDGAGRRAELRGVERLDGVDHADVGAFRLQRLAHDVELRLREDLDVRGPAEPFCAQLHLCDGLLARDQERPPVGAHRLQSGEEERRLAHARLPAHEHERCGNEAAAEHSVELGHAGRDARRLLRLDVDEAQERLRRRGRARDLADHLLDEGAEGVAARALPEPAAGRVAALGAGVVDRSLCHQASLRAGPDGKCAESATFRPQKRKRRTPPHRVRLSRDPRPRRIRPQEGMCRAVW